MFDDIVIIISKPTELKLSIAHDVVEGLSIGVFTDTHNHAIDLFVELRAIFSQMCSRTSIAFRELRLINGARIDCDYLNPRVGRGREYDRVYLLDHPYDQDLYQRTIAPTMITRPDARMVKFTLSGDLRDD